MHVFRRFDQFRKPGEPIAGLLIPGAVHFHENGVVALFTDAESRIGRIVDQGPARIYACGDAELARLVVSDTRLRRLCRLAEDRLLVVPVAVDQAFREALRQLGYAAPPASAE